MLPGASALQVKLFDHDEVFGDDFIGETVIDVENRYLDEKWMKMEFYPIETRKLYNKESGKPVGEIRMWVEILSLEEHKMSEGNLNVTSNSILNSVSRLSHSNQSKAGSSQAPQEKRKEQWTLSMMPEDGFEIRVIVWEALKVPIDDPEGMSDIYVTCDLPSFAECSTLKTDTHIRSEGFVDF